MRSNIKMDGVDLCGSGWDAVAEFVNTAMSLRVPYKGGSLVING
jgi:hypothetical protein